MYIHSHVHVLYHLDLCYIYYIWSIYGIYEADFFVRLHAILSPFEYLHSSVWLVTNPSSYQIKTIIIGGVRLQPRESNVILAICVSLSWTPPQPNQPARGSLFGFEWVMCGRLRYASIPYRLIGVCKFEAKSIYIFWLECVCICWHLHLLRHILTIYRNKTTGWVYIRTANTFGSADTTSYSLTLHYIKGFNSRNTWRSQQRHVPSVQVELKLLL